MTASGRSSKTLRNVVARLTNDILPTMIDKLPEEILAMAASHLSITDAETLVDVKGTFTESCKTYIQDVRMSVPRYMGRLAGDGLGLLEAMLLSRVCLVGERSLSFFIPQLVSDTTPWEFVCHGSVAYATIFLEWMLQHGATIHTDADTPKYPGDARLRPTVEDTIRDYALDEDDFAMRYVIRGTTHRGHHFVLRNTRPFGDDRTYDGEYTDEVDVTSSCSPPIIKALHSFSTAHMTYISGYAAVCLNYDLTRRGIGMMKLEKDPRSYEDVTVTTSSGDTLALPEGVSRQVRTLLNDPDSYVNASSVSHRTPRDGWHKIYSLESVGLFGGRHDKLLKELTDVDMNVLWIEYTEGWYHRTIQTDSRETDARGLPAITVTFRMWNDYPLNREEHKHESAVACAKTRFVSISTQSTSERDNEFPCITPKGKSFSITNVLHAAACGRDAECACATEMTSYVPPGETDLATYSHMYVEGEDGEPDSVLVVEHEFARKCELAFCELLHRLVETSPSA